MARAVAAALLLLSAALTLPRDAITLPVNPLPICFGGSAHSAADHVVMYGHHAGADSCGTPLKPSPRSSTELLLHTRGVNGTAGTETWAGAETAMVIIDMWCDFRAILRSFPVFSRGFLAHFRWENGTGRITRARP